jgi:flagellar protein FliS
MGDSKMINNPYQQYGNTQVMTATPAELTLMLYNGCIRFLKQAKQAMEQQQIEATNNYLLRAQNIINEFIVTLKMEYEISKNLYSLYDFMRFHLVQANIKKDPKKVQEVIDLVEELRDAWQEAMKIARATKSEAGTVQ